MTVNATRLLLLGVLSEVLIEEQAEWSQATFGPDTERGPIGSLQHLAKEVEEAIAAPTDLQEYADCLLLLLDATRRAGFDFLSLLRASRKKLEICRSRKWPKPAGDDLVEHIRDES